MTHIFSMLARRSRRSARMAAAALVMTACNTNELLEVDLDVITPEAAQNAAGAQAMRAAAIRDFATFFGSNVSAWSFVGTVTDELINARPTWEPLDQRQLEEDAPTNPWSQFTATHFSTLTGIRAMRAYLPDDATRKQQIGHVQALFGFSLTIAGEIFCNGIPFSQKMPDGSLYYDPHMYSNAEVYTKAIAYFDSALASLSATDEFRNMTRIGKARALMNLNQYAQAAAVVAAGGGGGSAAVPTSYVYNVEYRAGSINNGPADWIPLSANFSIPKTPEGVNGLDFANDPRVGAVFIRLGQDGTTPAYAPLVPWTQTVDSPIPLATGREARLIEAEADLKAGGSNWLTILNQLRSSSSFASQLPNLTDPGTAARRVDLIFKERAMWMYLTVHRMGDLRRLIRQYGRPQDQVFPTGPYFKGGVYGTDVNVPPSSGEHNNPEYEKAGGGIGKCTDRNA